MNKRYLAELSITLLISLYLIFVSAFIKAFSSPTKSVLLLVDSVGEANFEFYVIILPSIVLTCWLYWSLFINHSIEVKPRQPKG